MQEKFEALNSFEPHSASQDNNERRLYIVLFKLPQRDVVRAGGSHKTKQENINKERKGKEKER